MAEIRPTGDAFPVDAILFLGREGGGVVGDVLEDFLFQLLEDGGGGLLAAAEHQRGPYS